MKRGAKFTERGGPHLGQPFPIPVDGPDYGILVSGGLFYSEIEGSERIHSPVKEARRSTVMLSEHGNLNIGYDVKTRDWKVLRSECPKLPEDMGLFVLPRFSLIAAPWPRSARSCESRKELPADFLLAPILIRAGVVAFDYSDQVTDCHDRRLNYVRTCGRADNSSPIKEPTKVTEVVFHSVMSNDGLNQGGHKRRNGKRLRLIPRG